MDSAKTKHRRYALPFATIAILLIATMAILPIRVTAQTASLPTKVTRAGQEQQTPSESHGTAPDPKSKSTPIGRGYVFSGSLRARLENYNWWPTNKADGAYSFLGILTRAAVSRQTRNTDEYLEFAVPILAGLPTHAVAGAPQGASGQGASYYDVNRGQVASFFIKQGYLRFKNLGSSANTLRLGRFEYSDGAETTAADPTLAWVKTNRISQRLIGPFSFTHVGRSFDGFQFTHNTKGANVTAFGAFPTRGVFRLDGWNPLTDVRIASVALTLPASSRNLASEGRVFGIYYGDQRGNALKTDNRPLALRQSDHRDINIGTFGGNYVGSLNTRAGRFDGLVWGAFQMGQWGAQRQGAFGTAVEVGWQPRNVRGRPWLRAGYSYFSGDGQSANGQHGTFIPLLPTPRIYARYPFFTEANLQDAFGQLILRPNSRLTVRCDIHALALADGHDLWYQGGGAYDYRSFGYAGRPANGHRYLATLFDVSADYATTKATTLSLYVAYANGGDVIKSLYKSGDSLFGFLELSQKF